MKAGIHYFALPPYSDIKEQLDYAARCGYEGVELTVLPQGPLRLDSTASELALLREQIADAGLALTDLASTRNWQCSFTSGDGEIRRLAEERLKRQIVLARALDCDAILAVPGFVGMDHSPVTAMARGEYDPAGEVVDYGEAYDRALEAFGRMAEFAGNHEVTICLENVWTRFLLSPLEMRGILDQIGSPWVGAYFDTGNVYPHGYPEHWARILGKRVKRVHLKDFDPSTGGFTDLLQGCVPFQDVLCALKNGGYDGWLTVETVADKDHPERTAVECREAMRRIMKSAQV